MSFSAKLCLLIRKELKLEAILLPTEVEQLKHFYLCFVCVLVAF